MTRLLDGLSALLRRAVGRSHCAILFYHHVSPERFDAHLTRLVRLYEIVSMDRLVDAIERRDWSRMPPRSLVIHFDDGLREFAALEPILRRTGIPVTQFLLSEAVGTHRHGWWTALDRRQINHLKRVPDTLRRAILRERADWAWEQDHPDRQFLSWEELEAMSDLEILWGAHTQSHPQLAQCDDETAWREISESRRDLEARLGRPVEHFAYPSGSYVPRDVELARRAGFRSARTTDRGWNGVNSDLFLLRDLEAADDIAVERIGHLELISLANRLRRSLGAFRNRLLPPPSPEEVLRESGPLPEIPRTGS